MKDVAQFPDQSQSRLEQLEEDWLSGQIPDVASYFAQAVAEDPGRLRDIVELDMEYRWRRYHHGTSVESLDAFGFPEFPRLEHYASLLDESFRPLILNPEGLAEEYRVRTSWGDQPEKEQYCERLPEMSSNVSEALDHIDVELEVEGMNTVRDDRSSEETTQLFDQSSDVLPEVADDFELPKSIGKYQLLELLGRGGFGEVWKAHDPDLNRNVALKCPHLNREISDEVFQVFRQEAQKMASLERVSGVVPVYEIGEHEGIPFIASSYIDGEDLRMRQSRMPLAFDESVRIVADVADVLNRAHLKDLFHRDVKLSNILIDREGQVFLSDFGLCVSEQEQLHEGHSATGTYVYMAPEQILGKSNRIDGRTDIYALGVVLYRLLTGRLPFIGNTAREYMDQTIDKPARPLRSINEHVPEELERICLKCLQKNIDERYSVADDLARDLRNWLTTLHPPAPVLEPVVANVSNQTSSRSRWNPLLTSLLLFVGAGVGFVLLGGNGGDASLERMRINPVLFHDDDSEKGSITAWPNDLPESPERKDDFRLPTIEEALNNQKGIHNFDPDSSHNQLRQQDQATWELQDDGKVVAAYTKNSPFCLAPLGELAGEQKEVELQVSLLAMRPGSSAGFYYGMNRPPGHAEELIYWQAVIIERTTNGQFKLLMHYYENKLNPPRFSHQFNPVELTLADDEQSEITLVIKISKAVGIENIWVNDQGFPDLVTKYREGMPGDLPKDRNVPKFYLRGAGQYGLECRWNQAYFANLRINDDFYTFRKDAVMRDF